MARTVTALDGTEWRVGRQWWPWKPKRREIDGPDTSGLDIGGGADDILGVIVLVFAALISIGLLFTVVIPASCAPAASATRWPRR